MDVGLSNPPYRVCSCRFEQKHAHYWPTEAHFTGLWQYFSCTILQKKEEVIPLLGCSPPMLSSTSPGLLACLPVYPPCSGHCAGRHSRPGKHYLSDFTGLINGVCGSSNGGTRTKCKCDQNISLKG